MNQKVPIGKIFKNKIFMHIIQESLTIFKLTKTKTIRSNIYWSRL